MRALVQPDRMHRDLSIDPGLFELEQEHFFANTWNCVGHDSQLPNPGDYIREADKGMSLADRAAGNETFADRWMRDRATAVEVLVRKNEINGHPAFRSAQCRTSLHGAAPHRISG